MARYILAPFGGVGEINPFIWLARLLREHDHVVEVLGAPALGNTVIAAGVDFTSVRCDEDESWLFQDPDLDDTSRAKKLALQFGTRTLRAFYDSICMALMVQPSVLVASVQHLAARAVKEKYPVPFVSVHTQPAWSLENTMTLRAGREDWLLKPSLGMGWVKCGNTGSVTAAIAPALRKFCHEIGIKVPRQRLQSWRHPPDLDLMLFPEWFCGSLTGSPGNSMLDGFPLEDLSGQFDMPGDLRAFLATGERPVLLTLELRSDRSQAFFETGLRACALCGVRALVATSYPELLPEPLPSWVHVMKYHPFSEILPRMRAVVHDGGIGTLSQCLAAGVPQLITPMLRDQQGNAARVRWLGAGEALIPSQFSVESVAALLMRLTSSPTVRDACASVQALCRPKTAGSKALDALERAARGCWSGPVAGCQADFGQPGPGILATT